MKNIINKLSSAILLADKDDFHELESIRALFFKFADAARHEQANDLLISLAVNSSVFIEKMISGQMPDREKALSVLNNAVHAIQSCFEKGESACLSMAPEELLDYNVKKPSFIEDIDKNLLIGFIADTKDRLDSADQHLLFLESHPMNEDSLHALFRIFHTVKGDAGVLSYAEMAETAHITEDLLSMVRNGSMVLSETVLNLIFKSTDLLRKLISSLEQAVNNEQKELKTPSIRNLVHEIKKILQDDRPRKLGEILLQSGVINQEQLLHALKQQQMEKEEFESCNSEGLAPEEKNKTHEEIDGKVRTTQESMIKINTGQLDQLFNSVGELGVISTILTQDKTIFSFAREHIVKNISFLEKTTQEILSICSALRMMPIKSVFNKMARLVRDLSKTFGKEIEFTVSGEDTELDRSIVEQLDEPLIHLIRNAIDHGIESLPERKKNLKQARGTISLEAFHRWSSVYIKVSDDGRGLEREIIFENAVKQGIISPDSVMNDQDIYKLIFIHGFSTAREITDVSGRGVGMDVLKQKIDSLGGTIELSSQINKGTDIIIRLPMTLAVLDGIIVCLGEERYIIPTLFIKEVRIIKPDEIHMNFGNEMAIDFNDNLIPFYRLSHLTDIHSNGFNFLDGRVIIIDSDSGQEVALYIDRLLGQQQFVVKKLDKILSSAKNVSGSVIMPDGNVAFILDMDKIISGLADVK